MIIGMYADDYFSISPCRKFRNDEIMLQNQGRKKNFLQFLDGLKKVTFINFF
jgi:hypothetical protein